MYYQYFGLTEAPFSIAVNPRYLFMSARHRDALAHLLYGVGTGGGFILLTGEVGTGKTTVNRCLLEQLPHDTDIAIILNPALNAMELLATACDELGISYDADKHTLKTLTDSLHTYLLENHSRGRKTVLLIDEAQHLDFDVLEQIRLLTNLETNSEKLLQIILIGQPELAQMLAQPQLRQLNQRITARYNLEPLNQEETGAYIHHRLQVAGMSADRIIFPPTVVRAIYKLTRGIPRVINVLCDRVLLGAYGRNKQRADMSMLRLAAQEVLGEAGSQQRAWWRPAVLALAIAAMGGWWVLEEYRQRDAVVSFAPVPKTPAATEVIQSESQFLEPVVEGPPTASVPELVAAEPAVGELSESAIEPPPVSNWLLAPPMAQALLWSLYTDAAPPVDICRNVPASGIACIAGEAQTWDTLMAYDRPLLLEVITPDRFAASVLVLGIEGRQAWVAAEQGVLQIQLSELGPQWNGRYRFLWHPPAAFERPLALGDSSAAVAQVANLFAQLDDQPQALAGQTFNAALEQRVRLFQREQGLDDDGLVGVQTLLKLNESLGIDPTGTVARQHLQAMAGSGVVP